MTFTWMAKEQVVCNLVKTFFRPVAALATVSASCVESLPFCRFFLLFHVSIGIISFNSLFVPLILCFNWYHFIKFIFRSTHFMFQLVLFHSIHFSSHSFHVSIGIISFNSIHFSLHSFYVSIDIVSFNSIHFRPIRLIFRCWGKSSMVCQQKSDAL